jgi:mannose-6-phosphate isomerase-like protein (cupin superfamily)
MQVRFRRAGHSVEVLGVVLCLFVTIGSTTAAQLKQAMVTRIIQDVQLLPSEGAARAAIVNDTVQEKTAVRTGADSRSELTFTDQTLARLGANTIFTFNEGTRNLNLEGGVMLLRVPKNAGGARISTAAVSAAITGTTVMLEYHKHSYVKLIVLEGTARLYLRNRLGESVLVHAGQMLIVRPDAKNLPDPVDIDLARLMSTSLLIVDFPPLVSEQLVAEEISNQREEKAQGKLIDTNLVIYGRGTLVSLVDPPPIDLLTLSIDAFLFSPGVIFGSEIGALKTIMSPNPYVIVAGTKIKTAPLITTSGVTQQGKTYRGMAQDGAPTQYFFGSVSSFDNTSTFNETVQQPSVLPLATFRFANLQLSGNPTITVPSGGATNLALLSVGSITDAAPGGPLTFKGMNSVLLATQSSSISLDAKISFAQIPQLTFYARGAGSNLTVGSQVQAVGNIDLLAEGSVTVNANESVGSFVVGAGVDYLGGTGNITASNITINAGNNLAFATNNFLTPAGSSPNVVLRAGAILNLDVRTNHSILSNAGLVDIRGKTINLTADPGGTTIVFNNLAQVLFIAGGGGIVANETTFQQASNTMQLTSNADIVANSIVGADLVSAMGSVHTTGALIGNTIVANTDITSAADLTAFNSVSAGNNVSVTNTLLSPSATAGGNITAGHVEVQNINPFAVAPFATTLTAGAGGITPFVSAAGSGLQHTFNVSSVLSPNGIDFSGTNFGPGANGGLLTINAETQFIGPGGGGANGVNFNGADAPTPMSPAGSGGTLTINSFASLALHNTTISATTGIIDTNAAPSGAGGSVSLSSAQDAVNIVNSKILVSSSDPMGSSNRRSSASGGNISLRSDYTTGTVIQVDNSSQLLSLLNAAAPGPGGLITITATAPIGNSHINVSGTIEADQGGIDVRNLNDSGAITITTPNMIADIVKILALGDNSTLNVGGGIISAGTLLRLYAGSISNSNNSTINFVANCQLNGAEIDIAAHTVNINQNVIVSTGSLAHVFATVANYQGSGGSGGATTGMFSGAGAVTLPLTAAPPPGAPGKP